jgi:hypothetical protein
MTAISPQGTARPTLSACAAVRPGGISAAGEVVSVAP